MVVGGNNGVNLNNIELISLDPANHPVPDCLKQPAGYPRAMFKAGGAALQDGSLEMMVQRLKQIQHVCRSACCVWGLQWNLHE